MTAAPTGSQVVRVVVADDQTLVRQGIRSLLAIAEGVEVVAEAGDGHEALAAIDAHAPDVVLLDLRMPGLDGIATLDALRARGGGPPVLVLTTFDDDELVLGALRAGAKGYLLKDVSLPQLVDAIHRLADGGTLVQPAVTARVVERLAGGTPPPSTPSVAPPSPLTAREREILHLLAGGYANREIAEALHLSTGTVKNHVSHVLAKLGVRDRTRAVLRALDLGLIAGEGRDS